MVVDTQSPEFAALFEFLQQNRSFEAGAYKLTSLARRIAKRMADLGLSSPAEYLDYIQANPDEFKPLLNTILINVTSFFRDAVTWEFVAREVIPRIIALKAEAAPIRVWSAGCASGEEVYTLAILLAEGLGQAGFQERVKIYGTDADEEALTEARQGSFGERQVQVIRPDLVARYFERVDGSYVFKKELRHSIVFGRLDLMQHAPIARVDLISCRNTLMYLNLEAQAKVLERFAFALNPRGFLLLGKAEMLLPRVRDFSPLDIKNRVFIRGGDAGERGFGPAGLPLSRPHAEKNATLRFLQETVLEKDTTPQLVLDLENRLAMANEKARTLLGLSPSDLGRPFEEVGGATNSLVLQRLAEQAYTTRQPVTVREAQWEGLPQSLDTEVGPLFGENGERLGVKVVWLDEARFRKLEKEYIQSSQERETVNEELQTANEELETTIEELHSTIEELETTNEENQSSNEELETMNEELSSANEELEMTNEQLRTRTGQLDQVNVFLETILSSLHDAVVVLDRELRVETWNRRAEDLWGLRREEVGGQYFFNLDIGLPLSELHQAIRSCLGASEGHEQLKVEAVNRRGRKIGVEITCSSLRGVNKQAQGVLLLMRERPAA